MDEATRTKALDLAVDAARYVGREIIMPRLKIGGPPAGLEKKGPRDLVTEADRLSEMAIVARIRDAFPDHRIVAEEAVKDEVDPAGYRWYVDPIDGTTNFVHGLPLFTVSIACYGPDGGEASVVYAPYLDECFFGARGQGAFLNTRSIPLSVTSCSTLMDACLVTGFHYDMDLYPNADLWTHFLPRTRALRRLGSAALDLAFVAAGRFDGMWESGLNSFDIAAGCLLVQEAGGVVTDYHAGPDWLDGRSMLATGASLQVPLREEIRACRGDDLVRRGRP
ncbi:MAG: inositol monophosphatase family protein [Planctomycetota bacterium]